MRTIRLVVAYDGAGFAGWQRQQNALAVQQTLEMALHRLTGDPVTLHAASRTDAGVHALGQVCVFHTASPIPGERFALAVNALLPSTVSVQASCEVAQGYLPRHNIAAKQYRYLWYTSRMPNPFWQTRAWQTPFLLDACLMQQAAGDILGSHDFAAFMAAGGTVKTTVRSIHYASVKRQGSLVAFNVVGNGFLYNMVRILAGTLFEIGQGRREPEMAKILAEKRRVEAGVTAPPQGLYLVQCWDEPFAADSLDSIVLFP